GLTYYIGDPVGARAYHAIDVTDTTKPKLIASQKSVDLGIGVTQAHGLSVSDDGNRLYATTGTGVVPAVPDPGNPPFAGFMILDVSEIQQRLSNPRFKVISLALHNDGASQQHTIPIRIHGKSYLVHVDEAGTAGGNATAAGSLANWQKSCDGGMPLFSMARIYDISDEKNPQVVSKLLLEVHDPVNCDRVLPDLAGVLIQGYGSHYCSVDNRSKATTLACGYFNAGIRVFDIRDPIRPREIAYYNPAGSTSPSPGSNHLNYNWMPGRPDWCT